MSVSYTHLLGSRLKAIGAGETAARFAGIRVETTKILVFVAAGCITDVYKRQPQLPQTNSAGAGDFM